MRKTINKETISGRIYEHKLEMKTVQNTNSANYGTEFINGTIDVATDDECLNIVQVSYTYVAPTFKSGKANSAFTALKTIIESGKTVLADGKDNATMVTLTPSLGLNDFVNKDGEMISAKKNDGGFVNIVNSLGDVRNRFDCDFYINGTVLVEADPEKNIENDFLRIKGYAFAYNNALLPMEFVCKNPGGIKYFESLEASPKNPTFTKVWGTINSTPIVTRIEEESAFGEPSVKETTRTVKEWVITGTSKPDAVYELGTDITSEEMQKLIADREIYLADVKKRHEEYLASKGTVSQPTSPATATAAVGGFNF